MTVVTLPFASEQSQCYKLNPALSVLVSGTTCGSLLCHFQEPGHSILLINCGSSTFEQRNEAHHSHHPISKDPHYQWEARLRPSLDHVEEMDKEERRGGEAWLQSRTRLELKSVTEFITISSYRKQAGEYRITNSIFKVKCRTLLHNWTREKWKVATSFN